MLSPLRNRFGIPGAISVIALVFAMLGGAYAASNDSGKATASAKAKKGPRGPKGPAGPAGPAGQQGPAGANGKDGANGSNGLDGEDGAKGATGAKGTNGTAGAKGATGAAGAVGATGATGEEGSPWTAGGTLPPGETETGVFNMGPVPEASLPKTAQEFTAASISFPIPLAAAIPGSNVHYLAKEAAATTECPGSPADPKAIPGHLCLYSARESAAGTWAVSPFPIQDTVTESSGAAKTGATVFNFATAAAARALGTWAVTAPTS